MPWQGQVGYLLPANYSLQMGRGKKASTDGMITCVNFLRCTRGCATVEVRPAR